MGRIESSQADTQTDFQCRILLIAQRGEAISQGVHGRGGAGEGQIREDHTEFIATVTPGEVGCPQVLFEHLAQLAQHDIPGDMAVGVVDGFEMVDVDQGNRPAPMLALAALELDFQLILPGTVIEQAGEAVGAAQGQQLTFVPAQGRGLTETDPAQRQRIETQQGQTGI